MSTATQITQHQKAVFALSQFSVPGLFPFGADLESRVYAGLLKALENAAPTIGRWEVVWGPSVFQLVTGGLAANEMYVARSVDDPPRYVIAIAGTNPFSRFDWLVEDYLIDVQVPWVYAPSVHDARISLGIAAGLTILQNMKPSGDRPGAGTSLSGFLKSITGAPVCITVTGHSLGGALAPTLALWLADTQGMAGLWDPSGNATIETMPTAGFTAGNGAFAAHSDDRLGSGVARFNNSLDVVPRWFNRETLAQIPTLYEPDIPASDRVKAMVQTASSRAQNGDYTPIQASASPLPGQIDRNRIITSQSDYDNFAAQAEYQHFMAYFPFFNFDLSWLLGGGAGATNATPTAVGLSERLVPIGLQLAAADAPDVIEKMTAELRRHG